MTREYKLGLTAASCWLLARSLRFLPADILIRLVGKCQLASPFQELYPFYTLWGNSFLVRLRV